jgi:hypothetical protein
LIGSSYVEQYLENMIVSIFPSTLSTNKRKEILTYSGVLGSFGSKIEMAYAFRVIPKNIYDSLNTMRKLRNKAAHSSSMFDLITYENEIDKIFSIGPKTHIGIRNLALEILLKYKSNILLDAMLKMKNNDPDFADFELPFSNLDDSTKYILSKPEYVNMLKNQLPHWVLVIGISILCGIIVNYQNKITEKFKQDDTIYQIFK